MRHRYRHVLVQIVPAFPNVHGANRAAELNRKWYKNNVLVRLCAVTLQRSKNRVMLRANDSPYTHFVSGR